MYSSKIKTKYRAVKKTRIAQGDIYKSVSLSIGGGEGSHLKFNFEFIVVVSQDCDLDEDHKARGNISTIDHDKFIDSVLISPTYPLEKFAQGEHLTGRSMQPFTPKMIKKLRSNNEFKRYHYLPADETSGIPESVIDFKHVFTVARVLLYRQRTKKYATTLSELFREDLNNRMFNYLSRIGLPEV